MVRITRKHYILGFATAGILLGHGCSNVHLVANQSVSIASTKAAVGFCTTPADKVLSDLKFIFVVDRSGSNQQRYQQQANGTYLPLPGTDPSGSRRFGAILQFVQSYQGNPNIYWSMINFAGNVLSGANRQNFTNDQAAFLTFVQNQQTNTATIDGGDTNYVDVMKELDTTISNDIQAASKATPLVSSDYVIFFISDGAPIVNNMLQSSTDILNVVGAIAAFQQSNQLLVDGIQFNTGYYGAADDSGAQTAKDLLTSIASAGSGTSLDFSSGQTIDFSRFAVPTRISRFAMKEFWVVNTSTVWEGGALKVDSDGDGLSDDLEKQLGSNPLLADSDGNGVSDLVEYKISGKPCKDSKCSTAGADPFTSCLGLQQPAGSLNLYADKDGDGLNDCEEKLLATNAQDFDTNLDYVPDAMALRMGVNVNGSTNLYLDPDFDGITNYLELKHNTPMFTNNANLPGLESMTVNLQMVSSDAVQDCYSVDVESIATGGKFDNIRMYLIENTSSFTQKRLLRIANVRMVGGAVSARDSDFIAVP